MKKQKRDKTLRCIHRHSIEEHPHCFVKGLVKGGYSSEKEFIATTGLPWYRFPGHSMCYLDIESDGLKADFSTMLTWCIKGRDVEPVYDVVTREELFSGVADRNLINSCVKELVKYDIVCTYYGKGFDIPYIRTKALHYNIPFPDFGQIYHFDLYFLARSKLNLSRKSLDNVCNYLGIVGKTPLEKDVWREAKYGNPEAIHNVLLHNIADCDILEQLHKRLEDQAKWIRSPL